MEREESTDGHKHSLAYGARAGVLAALCALCASPAFGQSFGEVTNDKKENETSVDDARGFTAQVDIDAELFRYTSQKFSDAKERDPLFRRMDTGFIENYPFGKFNIFDDTNISFGYTGDRFGGKMVIGKNDVLGGIKLWIGFLNNKIKITAGNDIGYSYADSQGADAGLRVYDDNVRNDKDAGFTNESVDSNKNPDNITQDKGILFEFDLDPVKLAFAGGGNLNDFAWSHGSVVRADNNEPIYGYSFQYGINLGSKIGDRAKVNGAYIMQANKHAARYKYNATADKILAEGPDSEIWNHLFGLYASFYPFGNDTLGITLGYAGILIKYLDEFLINSETAVPLILKSGINLTARYKSGGLHLKTDHNVSFWTDKNYKIFNLYKPDVGTMKDYGLLSKTAATMSDVTHSFIWNGAGASYRFTELFEGSIYVRNLLRADATKDYTMRNMYLSCELKSTFRFNPNVEAYASLVYAYTGRTASKQMAAELREFGNNAAKDTSDHLQSFSIPIGITIKLQRDVPARTPEPKGE